MANKNLFKTMVGKLLPKTDTVNEANALSFESRRRNFVASSLDG